VAATDQIAVNPSSFQIFEERGVTVIVMQDSPNPSHELAWPAELERALALPSGMSSDCRAVVLTGLGATFGPKSVSNDEKLAITPEGSTQSSRIDPKVAELAWLIDELPVPLVAAVNGAATGYACLAALMSDAIVASVDAHFVHPFRSTGAVSDASLTTSLAARLGLARSMEFIALGRGLSAETALEWGLVETIVTPVALLEKAVERSIALAKNPSDLRRIRQLTGVALFRDIGAG
jgi:2-(1,2-epoxy-1,2-dihydrophenyl)acetyl-CoA isomerase